MGVIEMGDARTGLTFEEALDAVSVTGYGEDADRRYMISCEDPDILSQITDGIPQEFSIVVTSSSSAIGRNSMTLSFPEPRAVIAYMGNECAAPVLEIMDAIKAKADGEVPEAVASGSQYGEPVLGG